MDKPAGDDAADTQPDPPGAMPRELALRRKAEQVAHDTLTPTVSDAEALAPDAMRRTLHELRVHQIELEMQNEELRRSQNDLEAARARYFELYDLAPVGYCTVSERGLILQANLCAAGLLQAPRSTLANQPISRYIFRDDQDVYYLCRGQLLASGAAQACELRMVKSDGTQFWVQMAVTAAPDAAGQDELRVVLTDISERRLMQAAMQEREARYRAMVEWSPAPIAVHRDGRIVYANPAALSLFGARNATELVGKPVLDRVHPDFRAAALARIAQLRTEKAATPMVEQLMLRMDGALIDVEVQSIRTVFDGAPAIQVAMHDVSERVRLGTVLKARNSELEAARAAADKANQAKSDFLSRMSHELRTPLHAILGFGQILESGSPAPTTSQKRSVDQILQAGWYLLELINEILDLALVESGKLALSLESVGLAGVMLECRAMFEPEALKHGVRLDFPALDAATFVKADRLRLKQVLINLLSNAIKYNQAGGTVSVHCAMVAGDRIRIGVEDSGTGLDPDQLAQLFQPFNRLGKESSTQEGTGIGLVLCKRLIELMQGAIGVQSTVGQGSLFWIELELAQAPAPLANSTGKQETP